MEELELLEKAKNGDGYAYNLIIKNYEKTISAIIKRKKYSLDRAEMDDLIQCGRIAVYKAILAFDKEKNIKFSTFASRVVENELINYIKHLNSTKHKLLNETLPLNNQGELEFEDNSGNVISQPIKTLSFSPEEVVINKEKIKELLFNISLKLSAYEQKILELKLQGLNYKEIATLLKQSHKSIDNALNRIKNKTQTIQYKK